MCSGPRPLLVGPGLEADLARPSPCVCVSESQSPFLYGHQSHRRGYGLILTTPATTDFQIRSHFQALGVRTPTQECGGWGHEFNL